MAEDYLMSNELKIEVRCIGPTCGGRIYDGEWVQGPARVLVKHSTNASGTFGVVCKRCGLFNEIHVGDV